MYYMFFLMGSRSHSKRLRLVKDKKLAPKWNEILENRLCNCHGIKWREMKQARPFPNLKILI